MKIYGKLNESIQTIVEDNSSYIPSADEILMQGERPQGDYVANAQGEWVSPAPAPIEPSQLDIIEAQVMYTALLTDSLLEEGEE